MNENGTLQELQDLAGHTRTQQAISGYVGSGCAQPNLRVRHEVHTCEALRQIAEGPVWDGNLVSKSWRDSIHRSGLIDRHMGWNFLTQKGVEYCINLGILRA